MPHLRLRAARRPVVRTALLLVVGALLVGCPEPFAGSYVAQATDVAAPEIAITSPVQNSTYLEVLNVAGSVSDRSAVGGSATADSVRTVTAVIRTSLGDQDPVPVSIDSEGAFAFEIATDVFDGDISLTITAVDWNDNESSEVVTLRDPGIEIPSFTVTAGPSSATLEWTAVASVERYDMSYTATLNGSTTVGSVSDVTPPYVVSDLENGGLYEFRLSALRNDGETVQSGTIPAIPISEQTLLPDVSATNAGIQVSWIEIPGTTEFDVYRASSIDGELTLLGSVVANQFADDAVSAGQSYWYAIEPSNANTLRSARAPGVASDLPRRSFAVLGQMNVTDGGEFRDVHVDGGEWYVLENTSSGTSYSSRVIGVDVSDVRQPSVLGYASISGAGVEIDKEGDVFAIAATHLEPGDGPGLLTIDNTSGSPSFSTYATGAAPDGNIYEDSGNFFVWGVEMVGTRAFLAARGDNPNLRTFSITTPTAPSSITPVFDDFPSTDVFARSLLYIGNDLLVAGVSDEQSSSEAEELWVIDTTDGTTNWNGDAVELAGEASPEPRDLVLWGDTVFMNVYQNLYSSEWETPTGDLDNSFWTDTYDTEFVLNGNTQRLTGVPDKDLMLAAGGNFVSIIDMRDLQNPQQLGRRFLRSDGISGDVEVEGDTVVATIRDLGLRTLSLENVFPPSTVTTIAGASTVTTVATAGDRLFLGTNSGTVGVYDLAVPSSPELETSISVGTAIDTVVPRGDLLFVGFRDGGGSGFRVYADTGGGFSLLDTVTTNDPVNDFAFYGDYALAAQSSDGLVVYDTSDPGTIEFVTQQLTLGDATSVRRVGSYVALVDYDASGGYLRVIDMSDPASPQEAGVWPTFAATDPFYHVERASDELVYVAARGRGLTAFSLSDPTEPDWAVSMSATNFERIGDAADYTDVAISGSTAVVLDSGEGVIMRVDISDAENPVTVGRQSLSGTLHRVALHSSYAYVAAGSSGVHVVRLTQ